MKAFPYALVAIVFACMLAIFGCAALPTASDGTTSPNAADSQEASQDNPSTARRENDAPSFSLDDVPPYSGKPSAAINDDTPYFPKTELQRKPFMEFSLLDSKGRCGAAYALIDVNMLPTEPRGSIGDVRPSGWQTEHYDWVDGEYLFNRCHLLGYQLSGQNANKLNLITGTRSMNVQGMEPFETQVADYIESTGNHVLYRCTPVFEGDNLVASGVLLEALSVEDAGKGVSLCRWCYNVEPGVVIDYATGENRADGTKAARSSGVESEAVDAPAAAPAEADGTDQEATSEEHTYILNTNTLKFHWPDCESVGDMREKNKQEFTGTREEVLDMGYEPCGRCLP